MNPDSATPLRVAIAGASGRMGHMLVESVLDGPDTQLVGALERIDTEFGGTEAYLLGGGLDPAVPARLRDLLLER